MMSGSEPAWDDAQSAEEILAEEHGLGRRRRRLANDPQRREPWEKHR